MFVNLGYSQVLVYKSSHSKMALFGVKKLTRKKVLIGSHNAALVFVPIMVVVLKDWKEEAQHQSITDTNY